MNRTLVDRIADAVLYEGYILYPYRPAMKNRQRWTFGGLYPEAFCRAGGGESSGNQMQCLIRGTTATGVEVVVRFLHLIARTAGEVAPPLAAWPQDGTPPFRPVETLRVGERLWHTWQEAEEREVVLGEKTLSELSAQPCRTPFAFPGGTHAEPVRDSDGRIAGVLVREQQAIAGEIETQAAEVAEGLYRLTCRARNDTPMVEAPSAGREEALLRTLVSAHTILGVRGGALVSLLDPPECWRACAAACRNEGVWPVMVGEEGQTDTMLASPIILYDYPQLAPESPGEFFDGTEIDEMLTLRILTLTDEEKQAMAAVDERTGSLLARTEALAREQLMSLHGTIRTPHPSPLSPEAGERGRG